MSDCAPFRDQISRLSTVAKRFSVTTNFGRAAAITARASKTGPPFSRTNMVQNHIHTWDRRARIHQRRGFGPGFEGLPGEPSVAMKFQPVPGQAEFLSA